MPEEFNKCCPYYLKTCPFYLEYIDKNKQAL